MNKKGQKMKEKKMLKIDFLEKATSVVNTTRINNDFYVDIVSILDILNVAVTDVSMSRLKTKFENNVYLDLRQKHSDEPPKMSTYRTKQHIFVPYSFVVSFLETFGRCLTAPKLEKSHSGANAIDLLLVLLADGTTLNHVAWNKEFLVESCDVELLIDQLKIFYEEELKAHRSGKTKETPEQVIIEKGEKEMSKTTKRTTRSDSGRMRKQIEKGNAEAKKNAPEDIIGLINKSKEVLSSLGLHDNNAVLDYLKNVESLDLSFLKKYINNPESTIPNVEPPMVEEQKISEFAQSYEAFLSGEIFKLNKKTHLEDVEYCTVIEPLGDSDKYVESPAAYKNADELLELALEWMLTMGFVIKAGFADGVTRFVPANKFSMLFIVNEETMSKFPYLIQKNVYISLLDAYQESIGQKIF